MRYAPISAAGLPPMWGWSATRVSWPSKARPDKTTVLVVGDGGFLMTLGELETVVREDLPIVIVLMNDCAYGAELHFLRLRQQPVTKSVFPDVDFAPIAESFGFEAATIRTLED